MPKTTKTNPSVWTKVFRRIVQQLENDPDIRRVIGVDNIRSWKGVPADKAPFAPSATGPVMRLTPNPSNVDWYSPDTQSGVLSVLVEIAINSLSIDDVSDVWDLIVQALRPGNLGAPGLAQDLVGLGAETGEIVFADPALDPQPAAKPEGQFLAAGRFHLRLLRSVNP
jgi:hypothetical protein